MFPIVLLFCFSRNYGGLPFIIPDWRKIDVITISFRGLIWRAALWQRQTRLELTREDFKSGLPVPTEVANGITSGITNLQALSPRNTVSGRDGTWFSASRPPFHRQIEKLNSRVNHLFKDTRSFNWKKYNCSIATAVKYITKFLKCMVPHIPYKN